MLAGFVGVRRGTAGLFSNFDDSFGEAPEDEAEVAEPIAERAIDRDQSQSLVPIIRGVDKRFGFREGVPQFDDVTVGQSCPDTDEL